MRTNSAEWSTAGWGTLLVAVLFVGCSGAGEAPEIRLDRTTCARCGMLISELAGAAAYRTAAGETRAYDDLACLLGDLGEGVGRDVDPAAIWVHDHESGAALRANEAIFVRSRRLHTPMGGGTAAFASEGAASTWAAATQGELLGWAELEGGSGLALPGTGLAARLEGER